MVQIDQSANSRSFLDVFSGRVHRTVYRCAHCAKWVEDENTVWIPDWNTGSAYHVECAPEEPMIDYLE